MANHTTPTEWKQLTKQVQDKVDSMIEYANETWDLGMELVYVDYNLTSSRALGTCLTQTKHGEIVSNISLNAELLKEYKEVYIDDVVVHEVCHAIVGHKFPNGYNSRMQRVMPHGKEFKAVCSHFGNDGKSTTKLFSGSEAMKATRKTNRFTYSCGCMEHELSTVRHNKIQRGTASYSCSVCKSKLVKGKLKKVAA